MTEAEQVDLQQAYRDLTHIKDALSGVETTMLAGLVNSLADTTEKLMGITKELREQQLHPWTDTNGVVEKFPISKSALLNSECKRHYPTSHPVWNLYEVQEYFMNC